MARNIKIAVAAVVGIVVFTFVGGTVVQWLWNWLMPPLFGWRSITFWQAWGLLALCRILFGGMHVRSGRGEYGAIRHRLVDRMADRVAQRWEAMSPEERERFRQRLRERTGFDPAVPNP
jgi:uncharacterized membrane protein